MMLNLVKTKHSANNIILSIKHLVNEVFWRNKMLQIKMKSQFLTLTMYSRISQTAGCLMRMNSAMIFEFFFSSSLKWLVMFQFENKSFDRNISIALPKNWRKLKTLWFETKKQKKKSDLKNSMRWKKKIFELYLKLVCDGDNRPLCVNPYYDTLIVLWEMHYFAHDCFSCAGKNH